MKKRKLMIRCLAFFCLGLWLCGQCVFPASALESTTLYNGSRGEEVRELQQDLIDLGYLKGTADGIFGNNTENAVRKFQQKNKLTVDGLAGKSTREKIRNQARSKQDAATPTPAPAADSPVPTPAPSSDAQDNSSLFSSYATIRFGDSGNRVKALQSSLISLGFLGGKADGIYGKNTRNAVKSFQQKKKLTADGVAGRKTLTALQSALSDSPSPTPSPSATPETTPRLTPVPDDGELNPKIQAPSSVQLLHWFNDVKPSVSGGQPLLVYDPSSGLSWTLRILARGRHCDAEPLTAQDTRTMVKAFGGVHTWNQKAVYVKLPDGRWSVGATHDMPHDSGTIRDNNFNGHLCVHFLRDMDEAKKNDPNYGVANQKTIRAKWKSMTGEDIP